MKAAATIGGDEKGEERGTMEDGPISIIAFLTPLPLPSTLSPRKRGKKAKKIAK